MYKNISPVQTVSELQFIESHQPDVYFVPLNLDTLIHCKIFEKRFLNPANYLDSSFHVDALQESEKFTNSIPTFSHILAIQSEFVAYLRFFFYQIFYINNLLCRIIENEKIGIIHASGWDINTGTPLSMENFFNSRIVKVIFCDKVKLITAESQKITSFVYDYELNQGKQSQVLINSIGYNFNRLSMAFKKKGFSVRSIIFGSLSHSQRFGLYLNGNKCVEFDDKIKPYSKKLEENLSFIFDDECTEKLVNERIEELLPYFETQLNKCRLLDLFIENYRPVFSASYAMRGIDGYLLERSHQLNIPSIAIPHGTIAPAFNVNDKVYKKVIAEAVFSGSCTYVALQSKITQDALETHEIKGEPVLTGNLIFAEETQNERKYILYALTLKDFFGMQFFGVEMYYEFIENLNCLKTLQDNTEIPVIVQLHPSARKSKKKLQKLFPMLKFSGESISSCLKNTILTISYSSTVIEDSLYSDVPVILFDQWKRYQHCHAETEPSIENKAMYYVTSTEELILAVHTIVSSKNIQFSEYIFPGKSSTNFESLINKIL